jgi:hypothetical protein
VNQEDVKAAFDYNPETGELRWKESLANRRWRGKVAGCVNSVGYRIVGFMGKDRLAHRIAWLYVHGQLPEVMDHIDGDKLNNSIANLRPATKSTNGANRGPQRNNSSGFKGVKRHYRKWVAQITVNGRNTYIGLYNTPEEASTAYLIAAKIEYKGFARAS